jgi:hypothetical protein
VRADDLDHQLHAAMHDSKPRLEAFALMSNVIPTSA